MGKEMNHNLGRKSFNASGVGATVDSNAYAPAPGTKSSTIFVMPTRAGTVEYFLQDPDDGIAYSLGTAVAVAAGAQDRLLINVVYCGAFKLFARFVCGDGVAGTCKFKVVDST